MTIDRQIRALYKRRAPFTRKRRLDGLTEREAMWLRMLERRIDRLEFIQSFGTCRPLDRTWNPVFALAIENIERCLREMLDPEDA